MNKKGTPKISTLIISLALVSLFFVVIPMGVSNIATNYGVSFNNSEYASFNKLETLRQDMDSVQTKALDVQQQTGIIDRIGGLVEAGYNVLKTAVTSLDIVKELTQDTISKVDLGGTESYFYNTIVLMIVAAFVIGILISVIVKWWV